MNIITVGFHQIYRAACQIWHLKQSLIYLIGYFPLGVSLNTTVTVISTPQNEIVAYNTLQLTYVLMVGITCQAIGVYLYWFLQKRYRFSTKTMFNAICIAIIVLDL
jgi:MFS-type transporter involved in bile tolerance (Atg22 family)